MLRFLLVLIISASTAFAADKVTIEADSVDTSDSSVYHAEGNVRIFQGDKTLTADEIFYDKPNSIIRAKGNVVMNENGSIMKCSELEYNTDTQQGLFIGAEAFVPPYNRITADRLDRLSEYKYEMENITFSTCEGDKPDWSFNASKANLSAEGYLTAWHTTARIKNVPVLYTPFLIYPVNTKRKSGFLVPNAGFNSDIGAFVQPKYFWNIDVDQDATFAALLPTNSTALYSVEHRYIPNSLSSIQSYAEFANEQRRYPSEGGVYEKNSGRYFLYNSTTMLITENLYLNAYIDTVSDHDYLDDYKNYSLLKNYSNETNIYYTDIELSYTSEYADADLRYSNDLEYNMSTVFSRERTYNAPHISVQKNITALPVYFKYYLSYDKVRHTQYLYSGTADTEQSEDLSYDREHIAFDLYKPFDIYIGTLTPSLKLYYTRWHGFSENAPVITESDLSSFAKIASENDLTERRTYMQLYTFELNEIYRNYSNFRHSIYNTLTYRQTPLLNTSGLPDYIYEDEIEHKNEYEYTLSNYLTGSDWEVILRNSQKYLNSKEHNRYDVFGTELQVKTEPVRMMLKNEYNRTKKDSDYLRFELNADTAPFKLDAAYTYDSSEYAGEDNTSAEISARFITERYDFEAGRSISGINKNLAWKNFTHTRDVISVTYKKACWAFGLSYIREDETESVDIDAENEVEHTVMFTISLRGLGDYSSSVNLDTDGENPDEI